MVSPLTQEGYREYSDRSFLRVLGLGRFSAELARFWPNGGPHWDALAKVHSEEEGVLLVEAKSHIPEIYGSGCTARETSLEKIRRSLDLTKTWMNVEPSTDWLANFSYKTANGSAEGSLYQAANRLAHLFFFREVLKIPAWLVNVYFMDDPHRPTSLSAWTPAIRMVKGDLGVENVTFSVDLFLPAVT